MDNRQCHVFEGACVKNVGLRMFKAAESDDLQSGQSIDRPIIPPFVCVYRMHMFVNVR